MLPNVVFDLCQRLGHLSNVLRRYLRIYMQFHHKIKGIVSREPTLDSKILTYLCLHPDSFKLTNQDFHCGQKPASSTKPVQKLNVSSVKTLRNKYIFIRLVNGKKGWQFLASKKVGLRKTQRDRGIMGTCRESI